MSSKSAICLVLTGAVSTIYIIYTYTHLTQITFIKLKVEAEVARTQNIKSMHVAKIYTKGEGTQPIHLKMSFVR